MDSKKWYSSKTLWVNIVAILGVVANSVWGIELDAETQATLATTILAVVNIVLRLVTHSSIAK